MRIVLQSAALEGPTGDRYKRTIATSVIFVNHAYLLSDQQFQDLMNLFPEGRAPLCGIIPGRRNANMPQVRKISPRDGVFLYGKRQLYAGGVIAYTFYNPLLAERLWGARRAWTDLGEYVCDQRPAVL